MQLNEPFFSSPSSSREGKTQSRWKEGGKKEGRVDKGGGVGRKVMG
jgi:hypothetical protein